MWQCNVSWNYGIMNWKYCKWCMFLFIIIFYIFFCDTLKILMMDKLQRVTKTIISDENAYILICGESQKSVISFCLGIIDCYVRRVRRHSLNDLSRYHLAWSNTAYLLLSTFNFLLFAVEKIDNGGNSLDVIIYYYPFSLFQTFDLYFEVDRIIFKWGRCTTFDLIMVKAKKNNIERAEKSNLIVMFRFVINLYLLILWLEL